MTIIHQGTVSSLTGLVGGIVIAQRNGKNYLRRAPIRKANSWTSGQLLHRERFSKVNHFCSPFKELLIPQIWNAAAEKMSGYALFLKTNMPAFGPDGSLADPSLLKFSTGKLSVPPGLQARRLEGDENTIEVSWEKGPQWGGIHLRDELMVISGGEGHYSAIMATGLVKNDNGGRFSLPALAHRASHLYLFFGSMDRRDYSPSVCFGV